MFINEQIVKNEIETAAKLEIYRNFEEGGRFGSGKYGGGNNRWKPSHRAVVTAGRTLVDTGKLMSSCNAVIDSNWNLILSVPNLVYARIHQYGGFIRAKKRKNNRYAMENFFLYKYSVTGDPYFLASAIKVHRVGGVNIPARPYLTLPNNFDKTVKSIVKKHLDYKKIINKLIIDL